MRNSKYNPVSENSASGDHAAMAGGNWFTSPIFSNSSPIPQYAMAGGNWFTSPIFSNSSPIPQYAMAMPMLTPIPAMAPRLPTRNPNGIEIIAMINANSGTENFR